MKPVKNLVCSQRQQTAALKNVYELGHYLQQISRFVWHCMRKEWEISLSGGALEG